MANANGRATRYFEAVSRGMGPANLRRSNQRAVLTIISSEPGCSNADIARRTGLAPQSVSAVLADLDEIGLLMRGPARRGGGRGQPATPLFINPEGAFAIGAEIGWTRLEVALVSIEGKIINVERIEFAYPDATTIFQQLGEMVERASGLVPDRRRIVGLGLAMPSGIGSPASLLAPPPGQDALWGELDPVVEASRVTGLDVLRVNDGNAACWAEFVASPSPRPGNFAYLLIDTFVAAGIVSEDRLWEGPNGGSANLGSMLVCSGPGRSSFVHEVASLHALRQRLVAAGVDPGAAGSERQEAVFSEWIENASYALAQAILNARTVLEFDFAVIESELESARLAHLIERVRAKMLEIPSLGARPPDVRRGQIGRPAAAQGAAFIRMYRRFFSRELAHMES